MAVRSLSDAWSTPIGDAVDGTSAAKTKMNNRIVFRLSDLGTSLIVEPPVYRCSRYAIPADLVALDVDQQQKLGQRKISSARLAG